MIHRTCLFVLLTFALSGCGAVQNRLQMEIGGDIWIVTEAVGHDPNEYEFVPNVETLEFGTNADPQISVFDGCNAWNAEIEWTENGFVHEEEGEGNSSLMGCFGATSFSLKALIADNSEVTIVVVGDTLTMDNGTVRVTAERRR